jgi:hypothetical protein
MAYLGRIGEPGFLSEKTRLEHFGRWPRTVVHPTFSRWCSGLTWLVFHRGFGMDELVALRLHNAFAFALIACGIAVFVLPRYGLTTALVALGLTWGDVRLFGHAHSGQTDLVLSCVWLWAVLLAARGVRDQSPWRVAAAALVAGAALSTKMTGLLLVAVLAAWPVWVHGWRGLRLTAVLVLIPPLVFYVLNPQCWSSPIGWTAQWITQFRARDKEILIPSLFFGTRYLFRAPWYAPTVHGLITVPPAILLLAGTAAVKAVRVLWGARTGRLESLRAPGVLCAVAGAVPLVVVSLPGVPNHDLERLFLPTQPLLLIGAACGFHVLLRSSFLKRLFSRWPDAPSALPGAALASLLLVPTMVSAIRFHPYELTYFNILVGGPRGAKALGFDVAYFKQEINQQVLDAVNRLVPPAGELWSNFASLDLEMHQQGGRLRKDIQLAPGFPAPYVLVHARRSWMYPFEVEMLDNPQQAMWTLEKNGVTLVALYRVRTLP